LRRLHVGVFRTYLPMFLHRFGCYLLDIAETDEALVKIGEALRLEPNTPVYLCSLAKLHFARGELKEALAKLDEANRLVGSSAPYIQDAIRHVQRLAWIPMPKKTPNVFGAFRRHFRYNREVYRSLLGLPIHQFPRC
jgi:ATP/maltotriose-dependent transcriptional regulator MalT